jgi:uncharacterized protein (TIGR02466 family)
MNYSQIFPTVISQIDLSNDLDMPILARIIERQKTIPHSLVDNAPSSYGTYVNVLDDIKVEGLKKKIQAAVDDYAQTLGISRLKITGSWFNILGKGGKVNAHRHEMSVVSGALYVKADPGSIGLKLHSPLAQVRMFEFAERMTDLNSNFWVVPCVQGQLVLFPSWLEHSTDANQTDNRITVSFNTNYVKNFG